MLVAPFQKTGVAIILVIIHIDIIRLELWLEATAFEEVDGRAWEIHPKHTTYAARSGLKGFAGREYHNWLVCGFYI